MGGDTAELQAHSLLRWMSSSAPLKGDDSRRVKSTGLYVQEDHCVRRGSTGAMGLGDGEKLKMHGEKQEK